MACHANQPWLLPAHTHALTWPIPIPPCPPPAPGRETRSLKACYELLRAGWKDVVHMEGGLSQWRYEGLPLAD